MVGHRQVSLGLDMGRVITNGSMEDMLRELRRGRKDFRRVPHVGGVFKGVAQIVRRWFRERLWLISACDDELRPKLIEWLFANAFFRRAGLIWGLEEMCAHVQFCANLAYADKAPIARKLHLTHMVDDRPEVLIAMCSVVPHRFLFNPESDVFEKFKDELEDITIVWNWKELVVAIGATMAEQHRHAKHGRRKRNGMLRRKAH